MDLKDLDSLGRAEVPYALKIDLADDYSIEIDVLGVESSARQMAIIKHMPKDRDDLAAMAEFGRKVTASCIVGWRNIKYGGKEIKFSFDAAVKLLTKFPMIAEKVKEAVENDANFTSTKTKF